MLFEFSILYIFSNQLYKAEVGFDDFSVKLKNPVLIDVLVLKKGFHFNNLQNRTSFLLCRLQKVKFQIPRNNSTWKKMGLLCKQQYCFRSNRKATSLQGILEWDKKQNKSSTHHMWDLIKWKDTYIKSLDHLELRLC